MPRTGVRSQVQFAMVPVWVLERCSSRAVHVYAGLMKHANRERRAWPKTEVLAAMMNLSLRTVERAIVELRREGAIETSRRHAKNGAVLGLDFVLMQVDPRDSLPVNAGGLVDVENPVEKSGDLPANTGGQDATLTANAVTPSPTMLAVSNKEELDPVEPDPRTSEKSVLTGRPESRVFTGVVVDINDPCEQFRLAWNTLTRDPLPPCLSLTPKRRRLIKAALLWRDLDWWKAIFSRVNRSSFCRGEKGWVATLDFFLEGMPDKPLKVYEGGYDDHVSDSELADAKRAIFHASGRSAGDDEARVFAMRSRAMRRTG